MKHIIFFFFFLLTTTVAQARFWVSVSDGGSGTSWPTDAFVLTWNIPADNLDVTFPADSTSNNFTIDWGDGSTPDAISGSVNPIHTYSSSGEYTLIIQGTMPSIRFKDFSTEASYVTKINQGGSTGITTLYGAFQDCTNLQSISGYWDLSSVNSLYYAFKGCSSCIIDGSQWTSMSPTDLRATFWDVPSITNIDFASWNITGLISASLMFLNTGISTADYDALLTSWGGQNAPSNITFDAGSSQYTANGAGESGRSTLITTYGWTINDGGVAP